MRLRAGEEVRLPDGDVPFDASSSIPVLVQYARFPQGLPIGWLVADRSLGCDPGQILDGDSCVLRGAVPVPVPDGSVAD